MGQNSSSESNADSETRTAKTKSRKRKSGSLFCSNWTNVNCCNINVNVQEPVSQNRKIEEKSNVEDDHYHDSGENSILVDSDNDSGRGSNSVVASLETTSITTHCDTESLRHEQKFFRQSSPYKDRSEENSNEASVQVREKPTQVEVDNSEERDSGQQAVQQEDSCQLAEDDNSEVMDSEQNLIDFDDDSSRGSNSVSVETSSITNECDVESLRHEEKIFKRISPHKDRSEVYLSKSEIMKSGEDSIIESLNETFINDPNNQLELDKPGENNASPFTSNTDTQDVNQLFKKNPIPSRIEIKCISRHGIHWNSEIVGIYNHIGNYNEKPCYQHSTKTVLSRRYLWFFLSYWFISPAPGRYNRAIQLQRIFSDDQEIETSGKHYYEIWDGESRCKFYIRKPSTKYINTIRSIPPLFAALTKN